MALNLAVADAIKQSKVCRHALDVAFEISKSIRFPPKRSAALDKIKVENPSSEESGPNMKVRSFCPICWTVHGNAVDSIINNYEPLNQLWEECLDTSASLDSDVKGRVIGVQAQTQQFRTLFGLHLSKKILSMTDNLSRSLQQKVTCQQHRASL